MVLIWTGTMMALAVSLIVAARSDKCPNHPAKRLSRVG